MTLDLRSIPTQVVIQGATNLDVSQAFISLSISGNALDDSGWFKPRGQIVLGVLPGFAESFDCRVNPGRWAPGTVVAVSVWLGGVWVPLPWRLRILAYPNRPMPGSQSITLEVGTDADLLNYRAPEGDPGTDEYGTPTDFRNLANRALAKAGAPLASGLSGLKISFSPEKNTGESWISFAGKVAYASQSILWMGQGGTRVSSLSLGAPTIASYTVGLDEVDYVLSQPGEQPPEIVKVHGTTYLIEEVGDAGQPRDTVIEELINGITTRTVTTYRQWNTDAPTITETVSIPYSAMNPGGILFPGIPSGENLGVYQEKTHVKRFDSWGRFVEESITIKKPSFLIPFAFRSTRLIVVNETKTTNKFPLNTDPALIAFDVMTTRITIERALYRINGVLSLENRTVTTERWDKKGPELYLYTVSTRDESPDPAALPPRSLPSQFSPPPATEFKPSEKQRTEILHTGQATIHSLGGSSFSEKVWMIQLPSGMCVSDSQCRNHARLWGMIRRGRQFPIRWSADLTADWLNNFSPVARVDITANGTTTAYLVEGFSIEIDQRSAAIGGMGLEIGIVGSGGAITPPAVQVSREARAVAGGIRITASGGARIP